MTSLAGKVRNATARREVGRALHVVTCLSLGAIVVLSLARIAPRTPDPSLADFEGTNLVPARSIAVDETLPASVPETQSAFGLGTSTIEDYAGSTAANSEDPSGLHTDGTVRDAAGNPIANARVTFIRADAEDCPRSRYTKYCEVDSLAPAGARARTDDDGRFQCFGLEPAVDYDVFVDLQGADLWWIESCARPLARARAGESELAIELPYGIVELSIEVPEGLAAIRGDDGELDIELGVDRGFDDRNSLHGDVPEQVRVTAYFDLPFDIVIGGHGIREIRRSNLTVSREQGTIALTVSLEPEPRTGRILISVVDENMLPVSDVWLHKLTAFDPPAFEYVRIGDGSDPKNGLFVLDGLEPSEYTICALGESYGDRAPMFGSVLVEEGVSRELLLTLRHGEYLELSIRPTCPRLTIVELSAPDLDFEIGKIVEWSLAQRSSFGTYRTFEPGESYRSSIRVPVGNYELRVRDEDGNESLESFSVENGRRARIDIGVDR